MDARKKRLKRICDNSITRKKPILLCKLKKITKEEYTSSYKSLTNVWDDYLVVKHFSIKGQWELKVFFFFLCRKEIHLICLTLII